MAAESQGRHRWLGPGAASLAIFLVVTFANAGPWVRTARSDDPADPAVPGERAGAALLQIDPPDGATGVRLDMPVSITGTADLAMVDVSDADAERVPGVLSDGGHSWTSTAPLLPGTSYTVRMAGTLPDGRAITRRSSFTTLTPQRRLGAYVLPDDNETVGVGMPIIVRFDAPVSDRAGVQRRLRVDTSVPVVGAWHWFDDEEVHWRPREHWPSGTRVTVAVRLAGLDAGDGLWGERDLTVNFVVGPAHVSAADLDAHTFTVRSDGAVVRVLPMSGGRPKYPTLGGVHFVWGKQYDVLMDSETVGIPRSSPDGYYEHVFDDVAISTTGEYVHAAPWSVGAQGRANVSHGCINLAPSDAAWFYDFTQRGDIVEVTGSPRPATAADGEADWNTSWADWTTPAAPAATPAGRPRRS